jgi:hypothetical protein
VLSYEQRPAVDGPAATALRLMRSPWVLLPLILLLAAGLRWLQIDRNSFWLDEFLAVQNSTGRGQYSVTLPVGQWIEPAPHLTRLADGPGFWPIWTSLRRDTHPPLYFLLLNLWRQLFGESDAAARWLSAVFSLAAIALAYDVACLLHGRTVALWVALLAALAGPQIQYAQEARNYTLALALMLAAADAVVRIEQRGPNARRWGGLTASLLGLLLTIYLSVFVIAGLFLYALIRLRGSVRLATAGAFVVAGILFLLVWGPLLYQQLLGFEKEHSWQTTWTHPGGHLLVTLKRLAILPLRYFTEPMKRSYGVGQLAAVLYVLPVLAMLLWRRRDLLLWSLLGAAAIGPVAIADLSRGASMLALVRYTFLATVPAYALSAAMLSHLQGFARHAVPLTLALSCLLALEEPYSFDKADSRELAQFVASHVRPDDVMVIYQRDPQDWLSAATYLGLSHYGAPRCPVVFLTGPPAAPLASRIRSRRQVWLLSPTLAIPSHIVFPGSRHTKEAFFPWIGTLTRLDPASLPR